MPNTYLNNQPLPPAQYSGIRYLGILIDRRLTWKPPIISKTHTLNDRFQLLRPHLSTLSSPISSYSANSLSGPFGLMGSNYGVLQTFLTSTASKDSNLKAYVQF